MEREFGAVGVDQDIRVNRYHGVAPARSEQSRYSSRAALLSISSVGIRLPRVAGRSSRNSVRTGSPASSLRRALEMSAVSVIPRRRACSRAARIRSSSRFAVVFTAQPYTTSHTAHTKTGSAIQYPWHLPATSHCRASRRGAGRTRPRRARRPRSGRACGWWKVRTSRRPAFSITRRDAVLTAIVPATTRSTPCSVKPARISAHEPSVPYPLPHADHRSR